ncbi:MAG: hypothetical protein GX230_05140 [Lentisphaerae bacterium]|nr:hypothetical protein [Lentisphaerota bacterium]
MAKLAEPSLSTLTIAAVRFSLSGEGDGLFMPSFDQFLTGAVAADLNCDINAVGAVSELAGLSVEGAPPWLFAQDGLNGKVVRYNHDGRVLWQMEGGDDYRRAKVIWHPQLFVERYGSYRAAWSTGLGFLALGMRLRTNGGVMLHGAAAVLDGAGVICTGVSGVGKSTISRVLHAAGALILSDERVVIRHGGDGFRVYGTPWPSSAGFACNGVAPLRGIFFLKHGQSDAVRQLEQRDALRRLIPVSMISWQTPALLDPWLATVERLVTDVPCYLLEFRPTEDVVEVIRREI